MRQKDAFAAIRALGLTISKCNGEYRVAFPGPGNEASAYYTNDLQDALNTARAMHAHARAEILKFRKLPCSPTVH